MKLHGRWKFACKPNNYDNLSEKRKKLIKQIKEDFVLRKEEDDEECDKLF